MVQKRKHIVFSALDTEETAFEDTLFDTEPLPDEIFSNKELGQDLENALGQISEMDKAIVVLHHSEDMTFEEIAEVLERPMNTVKSQYRRALIKLRQYLTNSRSY